MTAPTTTAEAVKVGDTVISWYDDEPVEYGGPDGDRSGWTTLSFPLLRGGLPTRRCEPGRVAPADTPIPAKDDRVSVAQHTARETPYGVAGRWALTLPGVQHPSWHRIKRDAVAAGLRQLAILDWHAARVGQAQPPETVWSQHTNGLGDWCPYSGKPVEPDNDGQCPQGCPHSEPVDDED